MSNGWGGIRTPGAFRHTRFPGVHNQPLCHPSKRWIDILQYRYSLRESPVVAKATRERGRTPKAAQNGAAPLEHFARSGVLWSAGRFRTAFRADVRVVIDGTIRRGAIECRRRIRRNPRTRRSPDQTAFCKRSL